MIVGCISSESRTSSGSPLENPGFRKKPGFFAHAPPPCPSLQGMTVRSNFARVLRMSNDLFGGELLPPDAKS